MANPTNLPGDLVVSGDIRVTGSITPALSKANVLAQVALQSFPIPLTSFRKAGTNELDELLPNPGLTDDLGIYGEFGVSTPSLRTEDHKAVAAPTLNKARVLVQLPWEYVAGSSVTLRFMAGMITTIADQGATTSIDCSVYKQQDDPDDAIGSDLCATNAITAVNSLTFANQDFTITATSLSPGDILDVLVTTAVDDDVTGTAVIMGITSAKLLCDVR